MPSKQQKRLARDSALAGGAFAAGRQRKPRSRAARLRRFIRKLFRGSRAAETPPRERPGEDAVFRHLWRTATAASAHGKKFSIGQRNVLLFQMGKVASSALEVALIDRGINCFHCHSLRHSEEASRLSRMFGSKPSFSLAAIELKLLAKHTALHMLMRWYRTNEVSSGRRLKVITLTRDPATRYVSHLLQLVGHDPRDLIEWYREVTDGKAEGDLREASGTLLRRWLDWLSRRGPRSIWRRRGHAAMRWPWQ